VERLLKELVLDNGLLLKVTDESTQYYADPWNLKVVVKGRIKVTSDHLKAICPSSPLEEEVKEALGAEVNYHRELTRIGVRGADKEERLRTLLGSCERNALPYLRNPAFPEKLVIHQWGKKAEERTRGEVEG
jgi:hypothetical protein